MKLTKPTAKMNLAQTAIQRAQYIPHPCRFRQTAAAHVILVGFLIALSSDAHSEVTLRKIGDPIFNLTGQTIVTRVANPSGPDHAVEWGRNMDDFLADALDGYFVDERRGSCFSCPLEPRDGPYEQEFLQSMVDMGILLTDTYLRDDLAYPATAIFSAVVTPNAEAPNGPSLSSPEGPILPSSIFPLSYHGRRVNGGQGRHGTRDALDGKSVQYTDEAGVTHELDYAGLNYSHLHLFLTGHSPSRPFGFVSNGMGQVGQHAQVGTVLDADGNGWEITSSITVVRSPTNIAGDINYNGELDQGDLNILTQNVSLIPTDGHEFSEDQLRLDMNGDEAVDQSDVHFWVKELNETWIGDANLDGDFNSGDFVAVFKTGKYETGELANWSEGDWNSDGRFDSGDFVAAFKDGGYEMGARPLAAVPEPSGWILLAFGLVSVGYFRRR